MCVPAWWYRWSPRHLLLGRKMISTQTVLGTNLDKSSPLTFQNDNDLQIFGCERLRRDFVQGASSVNGVTDYKRRDEEYSIAPERILHLNVQLTDGNHLTFCRHCSSNYLWVKNVIHIKAKLWIASNSNKVYLISHLQLYCGWDDHAFP